MSKKIIPIDSFHRINNQHFPYYILNLWRNFMWESQWLMFDLLDQIYDISCSIRNFSKDQLIESNTNRPNICFAIVSLMI